MAVDTKVKRFSMLGFGNPTIKHVIPEGSIGITGRTTLSDLYSGVAMVSAQYLSASITHLMNLTSTDKIKIVAKLISGSGVTTAVNTIRLKLRRIR